MRLRAIKVRGQHPRIRRAADEGVYGRLVRFAGKERHRPGITQSVNFKTALNTRLHKNVSFRFSFKVRFDNVPAPRAAIPGADFVGGFTPLAETVDTLSEAALIVNFL